MLANMLATDVEAKFVDDNCKMSVTVLTILDIKNDI